MTEDVNIKTGDLHAKQAVKARWRFNAANRWISSSSFGSSFLVVHALVGFIRGPEWHSEHRTKMMQFLFRLETIHDHPKYSWGCLLAKDVFDYPYVKYLLVLSPPAQPIPRQHPLYSFFRISKQETRVRVLTEARYAASPLLS
jgi:hypothetical protein